MSLRTQIGNTLIGLGRSIGRKDGESELAVSLSDHSINVRMVDTSRDDLAWDHDLYRYGNVFISGYSNPIKPRVSHDPELANPDTVDVDSSDPVPEDSHVDVISSDRYATFMKQSLIESLLNPQEHWNKIIYALIGIAVLQFITIIAVAVTSGAV